MNPDSFLFWDDKHPTTAGHYWTAKGANDALTIPFIPPAKALNISTRVFVDLGERVSIAGFIVTGDVSKTAKQQSSRSSRLATILQSSAAEATPSVSLWSKPTAFRNAHFPALSDRESLSGV